MGEVGLPDNFWHLLFYFLNDLRYNLRVSGVNGCHLVEHFLQIVQIDLAQYLIPVAVPIIILLLFATLPLSLLLLHRIVQLLKRPFLEHLEEFVGDIDYASRDLLKVEVV